MPRELGIGLVAYSPLGKGFLTGNLRTPEDVGRLDDSGFRKTSPRFIGDNFQRNLRLADEGHRADPRHQTRASTTRSTSYVDAVRTAVGGSAVPP